MTPKELVLWKINELDRYLNQLQKYQGITPQELSENLEMLWVIERGLQVCIQSVLDIGSHILAEKGKGVESYRDIIRALGESRIIPPDFAHGIEGMAGLRNILVHEYAKVDLELITRILNNGLDDFRRIVEYITVYLEDYNNN